MTLVWTLLALFIILCFLILIARIRLLVRYEPNARHVFIGLEGIGLRYDFETRQYQGVAYGWVFYRRTGEEEVDRSAPIEGTRAHSVSVPPKRKEQTGLSFQRAQSLAEALPTIVRIMGTYTRKLWRGIRLDECRFHIVIGCPTPDATGAVVGGWYAIRGCLPRAIHNCVLTPDWEQTGLAGTGCFSLSMRTYRILLPTLWLAGQVIHHRMWRLFPREA